MLVYHTQFARTFTVTFPVLYALPRLHWLPHTAFTFAVVTRLLRFCGYTWFWLGSTFGCVWIRTHTFWLRTRSFTVGYGLPHGYAVTHTLRLHGSPHRYRIRLRFCTVTHTPVYTTGYGYLAYIHLRCSLLPVCAVAVGYVTVTRFVHARTVTHHAVTVYAHCVCCYAVAVLRTFTGSAFTRTRLVWLLPAVYTPRTPHTHWFGLPFTFACGCGSRFTLPVRTPHTAHHTATGCSWITGSGSTTFYILPVLPTVQFYRTGSTHSSVTTSYLPGLVLPCVAVVVCAVITAAHTLHAQHTPVTTAYGYRLPHHGLRFCLWLRSVYLPLHPVTTGSVTARTRLVRLHAHGSVTVPFCGYGCYTATFSLLPARLVAVWFWLCRLVTVTRLRLPHFGCTRSGYVATTLFGLRITYHGWLPLHATVAVTYTRSRTPPFAFHFAFTFTVRLPAGHCVYRTATRFGSCRVGWLFTVGYIAPFLLRLPHVYVWVTVCCHTFTAFCVCHHTVTRCCCCTATVPHCRLVTWLDCGYGSRCRTTATLGSGSAVAVTFTFVAVVWFYLRLPRLHILRVHYAFCTFATYAFTVLVLLRLVLLIRYVLAVVRFTAFVPVAHVHAHTARCVWIPCRSAGYAVAVSSPADYGTPHTGSTFYGSYCLPAGYVYGSCAVYAALPVSATTRSVWFPGLYTIGYVVVTCSSHTFRTCLRFACRSVTPHVYGYGCCRSGSFGYAFGLRFYVWLYGCLPLPALGYHTATVATAVHRVRCATFRILYTRGSSCYRLRCSYATPVTIF